MTPQSNPDGPTRLPQWVPEAARHYLVHTEMGLSIRALARASDCHPSTVLRQVRRFECRRDDPLIDAALTSLSGCVSAHDIVKNRKTEAMNIAHLNSVRPTSVELTHDRVDQEAKRILHRLCEPLAVLAVARDLESAVVVRETESGDHLRTAVVGREIAQAMALKDWISCPQPDARIARYFITNTGRAALRRLIAEDENRAGGFGERRARKDADTGWDMDAIAGLAGAQPRYHATESPLAGLARRKDRNGDPFITRTQVTAGERLREDFELAQVGMGRIESWDALMADTPAPDSAGGFLGAMSARARLRAALCDLGPGLGEVVFRCCCLLEGLEQTEKTMGWSARSGKIVLRIALERLELHYRQTQGQFAPLIG
ncbi:DUF6456 domain-containing protein [Yoonia sp.]|uniref:DUF6456 domain-containing protein n=1 Tax=Yoonia sp. TaxID=2212373 RepID=UPI0019E12047|nr:DUF6456 domain-containing protein [Yoonia sp.]MBE0413457.1 helix-turn-helix domain-containing protein [Yoonia sp.]